MRIITGTQRGKRLMTLPGDRVRPTTDRVKESLFNILQFGVEGRKFLDLFAGSGQIGLEALSRGAEKAYFVDVSRDAVRVIEQNVAIAGFKEKAAVAFTDYHTFLLSCTERFDIAFLDPPYETGLLAQALLAVAEHMNPGGVIVCEHPAGETLPPQAGAFSLHKSYRYGKIHLTAYRREN